MALYAAIAFGLWQFSWIGKDALAATDGWLKTAFEIAYIAGSIGWALWALLFWKLGNDIKKVGSTSAFNDELTLQNRLKAFRTGYFVLILGLTALIPAVNNFGLNAVYGLRLIATLGIIIPFILFALAEIKDDKGAA